MMKCLFLFSSPGSLKGTEWVQLSISYGSKLPELVKWKFLCIAIQLVYLGHPLSDILFPKASWAAGFQQSKEISLMQFVVANR